MVHKSRANNTLSLVQVGILKWGSKWGWQSLRNADKTPLFIQLDKGGSAKTDLNGSRLTSFGIWISRKVQLKALILLDWTLTASFSCKCHVKPHDLTGIHVLSRPSMSQLHRLCKASACTAKLRACHHRYSDQSPASQVWFWIARQAKFVDVPSLKAC